MLLQTPAAGSIRFGMTLFSILGFTMLVRDCGAQLLTVLVLVQSVPLLGGLPTMAMSPTRLCYLSIAGTVVGEALGHVHTPAGLHTSTLGPTAAPQGQHGWLIVSLAYCLQGHVSVLLRGGTAGVLAVDRLCTGRRGLTPVTAYITY